MEHDNLLLDICRYLYFKTFLFIRMWATFLQFLRLKRFVSTLPTWQGVFICSDAVAFYWVKHEVRLRGAWPSFRGRKFFHLIPRSWLHLPGLWRKMCPAHHPPRFKALLSVRDRPVEGGISRLGSTSVDHFKSPALTRRLMSTQQRSLEKGLRFTVNFLCVWRFRGFLSVRRAHIWPVRIH